MVEYISRKDSPKERPKSNLYETQGRILSIGESSKYTNAFFITLEYNCRDSDHPQFVQVYGHFDRSDIRRLLKYKIPNIDDILEGDYNFRNEAKGITLNVSVTKKRKPELIALIKK